MYRSKLWTICWENDMWISLHTGDLPGYIYNTIKHINTEVQKLATKINSNIIGYIPIIIINILLMRLKTIPLSTPCQLFTVKNHTQLKFDGLATFVTWKCLILLLIPTFSRCMQFIRIFIMIMLKLSLRLLRVCLGILIFSM